MSYYGRLASQAERDHSASALLARMHGKGYLRVTYFIVYALWKIGKLPEALLPPTEVSANVVPSKWHVFSGVQPQLEDWKKRPDLVQLALPLLPQAHV